jgi:hypothetical protein
MAKNDIEDIDNAIEDFRRRLRANSVPMRLRDRRMKSDDGYPDYVTQAEMDASAMLNENYRENIRNLELLKQLFDGENNENMQ